MESLSKSSFNNYVVAMRHNVRRARVQTIHKLTKVIKSLREKKGTDEQKEKNNTKADRLAEEILVMHKLKEDEISKECLMSTKTPQEHLADVNSSIKTRAWARLSMHNSMAGVISKFHYLYPDWREAVPRVLNFDKEKCKRLLDNQKRKYKGPDRFQKRKDSDAPAKSENMDKSVLKLKGNTFVVENIVGDDVVMEQFKTKNKEQDSKLQTDVNKGGLSKDVFLPVLAADGEDLMGSTESKNVKFDRNINVKIKKGGFSKSVSVVSTAKYEDSDQDSHDDSGASSEDNDDVQFRETIPPSEEKHVDPFFVTADNKDYLSYTPIVVDENLIKQSEQREKFKGKRNGEMTVPKLHSQFFNVRKPEGGKIKRDDSKGFKKNKKSSEPIKEEILHPSWQAKKKLSTIPSFEGKKITFD